MKKGYNYPNLKCRALSNDRRDNFALPLAMAIDRFIYQVDGPFLTLLKSPWANAVIDYPNATVTYSGEQTAGVTPYTWSVRHESYRDQPGGNWWLEIAANGGSFRSRQWQDYGDIYYRQEISLDFNLVEESVAPLNGHSSLRFFCRPYEQGWPF